MKKTLATLAVVGMIAAGAMGVGVGVKNNPNIPSKNPHYAYINDTLTAMTASEKAAAKGLEIKRVASSTAKTNVKFSGGDYDIKIDHINAINKGVEVFAQVWNPNGTQIGFGDDGTVDIERFVIINPPILVDDPNGDIFRLVTATSTVVATSTGATTTVPATYRRLREDPKQAILDTIAHTVSIKKQKFDSSKIVKGKVGNTTTTVYPDANPESTSVDGRVNFGRNTTWSTVHDAATGNGSGDTATADSLQTDKNASGFAIWRTFLLFDTSSIGSADTVSAATLSTWDTTIVNSYGDETSEVVATNPASNTALTTADYDALTFSSFSSLAWNSQSTGAYNDFVLNASGIAAISTTGITKLGIITGRDLSNTAPVSNADSYLTYYMADQTGTTNDPKLVIEHTAAASAPVFHPHEF